MSTRPPVPLIWSHTRDRAIRDCPRQYYFRYHLAPAGRRPDAPPGARRAFVLSRLVSLPQAFGIAVHARAREIAEAVLARRPLPLPADLIRRTRRTLGILWRTHDRTGFLRRPSNAGMLAEHYYRSDSAAEGAVESVRGRMGPAHENLLRSSVWRELADSGPAGLHALDAPLRFRTRGADVWVAPDLVYRTDSGWAVVDWKTGSPWGSGEQTAAYGFYLRASGLAPSDPVCTARVIDLRTGDERSATLTGDDLEGVAARIYASTCEMEALARLRSSPPPQPVRACQSCVFRELCAIPDPSPPEHNAG